MCLFKYIQDFCVWVDGGKYATCVTEESPRPTHSQRMKYIGGSIFTVTGVAQIVSHDIGTR